MSLKQISKKTTNSSFGMKLNSSRTKKSKNSKQALISKKQKIPLDSSRRAKLLIEEKCVQKFERLQIQTSHRIIIGNSQKMPTLKKNSVHLIITSPPYYNAKSYSQWKDMKNYLADMKKTFKECFRVLHEGRKFCLNISDLPEKGESGVRWNPLGPDLLKICLDIGFELVDRVFWFKTPLKGFQYGSLPFPPSPLINDSVEYIYILRKPGKSNYSYLTKDLKESSRIKRDEYIEFTKQIWSIRRVQSKHNVDGHIAPFPDELPMRCIKLYSFAGDMILDPFGGRGTTSKMAMNHKRNSILYEKNKQYKKLIKQYLITEQTKLPSINPKISFECEK